MRVYSTRRSSDLVFVLYRAREFNLIEKKASREKAKYLKYKSLNKASSKKNTPVILEDSESDSSSSKEEISSSEE